MSIRSQKKKRNYYRNYGNLSKSTETKTFLLRYEDKSGNYLHEGPFSEKIAMEKLNSFLKAGVCSWLVSYNVD